MKYFLPLALILFSPLVASNEAIDKALLQVMVNSEDVGVQAVVLKNDDVFVSPNTLKEWRIKSALWSAQTQEVSLNSLKPHITYSIDKATAQLNLEVEIDDFEPQVFETQTQLNPVVPDNALQRPALWSGFFNYALDSNFSQPKGFDSLTGFGEVGVTVGNWFGFSSFSANYLASNSTTKMMRGDTYLQWEDTETRQRVILGDFQMNSPTLLSGGKFGGVLWQSNFRQYGQFQFAPSFDMNANVQTPSHAELYINNVKTREWDLQPGSVNLPSLLNSGQGDATLVLTDAFGRQQTITQPFYVTQQLLKEGLHDFSYGLGAMRNFNTNKVFDYGDLALFGNHRYGFTNNLSAGMAFTTTTKKANLGASLTRSFAGNSVIDSAVSVSHQKSLNGYLAHTNYQFTQEYLNLSVNAGYASRYYGGLYTDADSLQKNKYRMQSTLNLRIPETQSSVGVGFSQSVSWLDTKSSLLSLFFRQSLFKGLTLNTQVNHDLTTGDNIASLSLNYFPTTEDTSSILYNNNLSYETSYDDKTHVDRQNWQTQKQGNIGEGYNYTAALQKEDQKLSGFARYQYKNDNGIYTANYAQNEQTILGNISVAGSLVTADNEIHLSRPITDSFAVVKVSGTEEDVAIYNDGALLGHASGNKDIVIPTLQSRRIGKLGIKPKDIGLALVADRNEQAIDIGVRTAHIVEFNMTQFVAVEGRAYTLAKNGTKEYLEALPLEYTVNGKTIKSFVGNKGFFYLENVPVGDFKAVVKRYQNDCTLNLTIPKSDKIVINLGDVACVKS